MLFRHEVLLINMLMVLLELSWLSVDVDDVCCSVVKAMETCGLGGC